MIYKTYFFFLAAICFFIQFVSSAPTSTEEEIADLERELSDNNLKVVDVKKSAEQLKRLEELYESQKESEELREKKRKVKDQLEAITVSPSSRLASVRFMKRLQKNHAHRALSLLPLLDMYHDQMEPYSKFPPQPEDPMDMSERYNNPFLWSASSVPITAH